MLPTYRHNDYVVGFKWRYSSFQPGDAVVVDHPTFGKIIKRIQAVSNSAVPMFHLQGDNATMSTSASDLGSVDKRRLIAKVVFHFGRSP